MQLPASRGREFDACSDRKGRSLHLPFHQPRQGVESLVQRRLNETRVYALRIRAEFS